MRLKEIEMIKAIKPLTPQKARIAALKKQKDNASAALKAERNRQTIAKAQQQIAKAAH
jgi:hypothetical protein